MYRVQLMFEGGMSKRKDIFRQARGRDDVFVTRALQADEANELEDARTHLFKRAAQKLEFQHAFKATIEADRE